MHFALQLHLKALNRVERVLTTLFAALQKELFARKRPRGVELLEGNEGQ